MLNKKINAFWSLLISGEEEKVDIGFQAWNEFDKNNVNYKSEILNKFPSKFSDLYTKINLHDFELIDVNFCMVKNEIVIHMFDYYQTYGCNTHIFITYKNIDKYLINICDCKNKIYWSNDIFLCEKSLFQHRILLTDYSNIDITFKDITIDIKDKMA